MAVPSSGEIRLARIRGEFESNNYNNSYTNVETSLGQISIGTYGSINTYNAAPNRPDGNQPHKMSEFHAYDHDYSPGPSFSATVTVGTDGLYSSQAYGYGSALNYFPSMGSINNTNFNGGTLTGVYWQNSNNVFLVFSGTKPSFNNMTIGTSIFPGSSSWVSSSTTMWRYSTTTNPFGTTNGATRTVTANY